MTPAQAAAVQAAVLAWARQAPGVRAVALVGSWARGEARPDSDLDLMVLTDGPFAAGVDWPAHGLTLTEARRETWCAAVSHRLFLAPDAEVELTFAAPSWAARPLDAGTRRVAEGGLKALFDPDGLLAGIG